MYRINSFNGYIICEDGSKIIPPYDDPKYLEYASWVGEGNQPEEFYLKTEDDVPQSVSRFQARAALYQAGLFEIVDGMMNGQSADMMHKLAWNDAQEFYRSSALVQGMTLALNLTSEQVDDLFRSASKIIA